MYARVVMEPDILNCGASTGLSFHWKAICMPARCFFAPAWGATPLAETVRGAVFWWGKTVFDRPCDKCHELRVMWVRHL